jgi:hypothetical protein
VASGFQCYRASRLAVATVAAEARRCQRTAQHARSKPVCFVMLVIDLSIFIQRKIQPVDGDPVRAEKIAVT